MKTLFAYLVLLTLFVHFHTAEGPKPLYENGFKTTLPSRVLASINQQIVKSCQTQATDYKVGLEKIVDTSSSFLYQVQFAASAFNEGEIVLEEKHSGEVVLQKIECPGKNGQWYSYNNPAQVSRQIAGL